MTVADISCPSCGAVGEVRKVGIGQYRCGDCGDEFSAETVLG
ncbi:hypothetical protein ACFQH6_08015 [Halobacteriaceae archaeon GCM10025711]